MSPSPGLPVGRSPRVFILAYSVVLAGIAAFRTWLMIPSEWDLGHFVSSITALMRRGPLATVDWSGLSVLGDHFSPLLFVLGPLSWLPGFPTWLVIVQAGSVGLALWLLAGRVFATIDRPLAWLLLAGAALQPALISATLSDFHMNVFGLPILVGFLLAIDEFDEKRMNVFGALMAFVREDFVIIAVLTLLLHRDRLRRRNLVGLIGAYGVSLLFWRLLASDSGVNTMFWYVDLADPSGSLGGLIRRALEPIGLGTVLVLALPWIGLGRPNWRLVSPVILVHAPLFFSDWVGTKLLAFHYFAPIPLVLAIGYLSRFRTQPALPDIRYRAGVALTSLIFVLGPLAGNRLSPQGVRTSLVPIVQAADDLGPTAALARRAVDCITPEMSVAASGRFIPLLSTQRRVSLLPSPFEDLELGPAAEPYVAVPASPFRPDAVLTESQENPEPSTYVRDPDVPVLFWHVDLDGSCSTDQ